MPDRVERVRLKVERAKKHINDLVIEVNAFRQANGYGPVFDAENAARSKRAGISIEQNIPAEIPLVAGDAIHNLRTALEHLAWQLVESNGGIPSENTGFPIKEKAPSNEAKPSPKIQGMSAEAISLIESIQPYHAQDVTKHLLWILHQLDIYDKHRLLFNPGFKIRSNVVDIGIGAFKPRQIGPGQYRFEFTTPMEFGNRPSQSLKTPEGGAIAWVSNITPAEDYKDFDGAFEITFYEPEIVKGKPVVEILNKLAEFVDGIISQFAPLL